MKNRLEILGTTYSLKLFNETFVLDVQKSIFWQEQEMLIVSDLHLGKAGHFRKHGVPIPREIHVVDLQRMNILIATYQPKVILFLGDLFHSTYNDEWQDFLLWSGYHHAIRQVLVVGNHDILTDSHYKDSKMEIVERMTIGPFSFTHEMEPSEKYNVSGHVHPAVRVYGLARQSLVLPCFYFGKQFGILPSFGNFTGNHPVKPKLDDQVFGIAEDLLVGLNG